MGQWKYGSRHPYNMTVANKFGKVFFRLLMKNFPSSSNLYQIFKRNTVQLCYSSMPNVANLIYKSNLKNLGTKQRMEPQKLNCVNKATCVVKDKG